jgi:hypothetical protein
MSNESVRLYSLDLWQGMADHDPMTADQGVQFGCRTAQFHIHKGITVNFLLGRGCGCSGRCAARFAERHGKIPLSCSRWSVPTPTLPHRRRSALLFPHGIQLLVARVWRDRELPQDHLGRPIIVRCIPAPARRIAPAHDARSECRVTIRVRFLLTGTTGSILACHLGREGG